MGGFTDLSFEFIVIVLAIFIIKLSNFFLCIGFGTQVSVDLIHLFYSPKQKAWVRSKCLRQV